jgi:hypothetical protein
MERQRMLRSLWEWYCLWGLDVNGVTLLYEKHAHDYGYRCAVYHFVHDIACHRYVVV